MKRLKYPLIAILNLLISFTLLLAMANQTTLVLSSLLTVFLLFIVGVTGIYYIIRYRNYTDDAEPENLKSWFDLAKFVDILLIIAFVIRFFVFQPYLIEGTSMEVTLHDKEFILVDRLSYRLHEPKRGDIIVFHPINSTVSDQKQLSYIKRIIGLPGEKVTISDGNVYVNDRQLEEPYLKGIKTITENPTATSLETSLGPDEYYVMGDNRSNSTDSRIIGPIKIESFVGKAFIVLFPASDIGLISHSNASTLK